MLTIHYPSLDSTNACAKRLAAVDAHRLVRVTAETQTQGRGRGERSWHSPRGGAWLSLLWPNNLTPAAAQPLPLLVGLAVCDALAAYLPAEEHAALGIKWPNDVLWHDRKLAGILCEQPQVSAERAGPIVIGVGVNGNTVPDSSIGPFRLPPTCLQQIRQQPIEIPAFLDVLTEQLQTMLAAYTDEGLSEPWHQRLNQRLAWRDQPVMLQQNQHAVIGRLHGVDARGRLQLITQSGGQTFESGELLAMHQHAWAGHGSS
jgi:BirA family biotin operon repressor/biotin-[acetyl-CoA-carboxylase] ligase